MMLLLGLTALLVAHPLAVPTNLPALDVVQNLNLPLSFVPNAGQTDSAVHFQVHDAGGTIFFNASEAVLTLPATQGATPAVVQVQFQGASPEPAVLGVDRLPGIVNYFIGDDPAQWRTNLPTYAGIVYQGLYPGIDLRYDGTSGRLKGTYVVAPGADPAAIQWRHAGAADVRLDRVTGNLLIALVGAQEHTLVEEAPIAWQVVNGERVPVAARYALAQDGSVSFVLGSYDPALPLTIDPTLSYATYLGGSGFEKVEDVALDADGNVYVAGNTTSTDDFPTTAGAYQTSSNGLEDVFVTKINPAGDALVYSTFIGGSQYDYGDGVAVDGAGNAYITGHTNSTDFPTQTPLQASNAGLNDAFVVKLNAAGNALVYSTYLGGSGIEEAGRVAVDATNNAYVIGTTFSSDLFAGTYNGDGDAFVAKLNADGNALVYGMYLGGSGSDFGSDIAVDASGSAYVVGEVYSTDFPTQAPFQASYAGQGDLFVAKLQADGSGLLYSTYLGGSDKDYSYGIALDGSGNAHVTGNTDSTDFPTTPGAFDTTCGTDGNCNYQEAYPGYGYSHSDVFVTKLLADGSDLLYSTYLGGSKYDKGASVVVDGTGHAYVTGDTFSADFPTLGSLQDYSSDAGNTSTAFVTKLETDGSDLVYSTYLGGSSSDYGTGIAVDGASNVFVVGMTFSDNFPTQNPIQGAHGGGYSDAFVAKIGDEPSPTPTPGPNLNGSHKAASKYQVALGEMLTYTIHLHNTGTVTTTADVSDTLPSEMDYVSGSADASGGVYDPGTRTVSWSDVTVNPGEDVPLSFVVTATTVETPTLVTNVAVIVAEGETLERRAVVLLSPTSPPPPPPPGPNLRGSHKIASQYTLAFGEVLTYTIRLHNSGAVLATVDVTDPIPSELSYIAGSATGGGVYDAGTETLTWTDVVVPSGSSVSLSFAVTMEGTIVTPAVVVNTATIATDKDTFERSVPILLVTEPVETDHTPPVVHDLTIDEQDVLTSPDVTLHISATDDVEVRWMYLREWQLATTPWPHWEVAQSSGWIPYQADYDWTLGSESGVHFVGVWVADGGHNLSKLVKDGLDFASLLLPDETVARHGLVPYLVHYEAGVTVNATLTPSEGDADLYVWYPGKFGWPDEKSTNPGTSPDSVSFETPEEGTYLFLVHGYTAATYDLSITPGGGPSAWSMTSVDVKGHSLATSFKGDGLISEPVLSQSGPDPLADATAPEGPFMIHLPVIVR
jgi:uncharacterized repeat protein (TIGR01451 family)